MKSLLGRQTRLLSFLALVCFSANCIALPEQPNILLITADDLGFDDLSVHKNPLVSTPSLDQLAQQSVQFSDFSVTPVCATTRASLLTGRHFYKTGVSGVHGGRDYMRLEETLVSELLQKTGYATGTWGKWHIGKSEGYLPWDRGFDQAYYAELYRHQSSSGFFNGKSVKHDKWVSEVVTDYAIEFMQQHKQQPFFAYVSYLAPHEPWLAPEHFTQPYHDKGERPAIANLYGMISEMDFHIGRLLDYLDKSGLSDNTLVVFLSDNGPWWDSSNLGAMTKQEWLTRNPSKMNGNKGQSWQNGIRSPLFVRMGRHFKASTVNRYVNVMDITPTLLELTSTPNIGSAKQLDGESFVPFLKGQIDGENNRVSYIGSHDVISHKSKFNQWTPIDKVARSKMEFDSQLVGLRNEKYKLLLNPSIDRAGYPTPADNYVLLDMQSDPLERQNLYAKKPEVARKMKSQLQQAFLELRDGKTSFSPPVYLIGGDNPVSVINGFGPSSTGGNTLSKAHRLTGLKSAGDFAQYAVRILQENLYKIYIKQTNTDAAGLDFSLRLQGNIVQSQFSGELLQEVGSMMLQQGDATLNFEILANQSIKPWAEVTGLRRIILVPAEHKIDVAKWKLPD